MELENLNPNVYRKSEDRKCSAVDYDNNVTDPFDEREIFGKQNETECTHITFCIYVWRFNQWIVRIILDLVRLINDPEHPLTLEELHVVQQNLIKVDNENNQVFVQFTPTIPHCSMATLIGLSIRVKLLRSLPPKFKVTVEITPGTHTSETAVNKQLADKERVAAALENADLINVINQCIAFWIVVVQFTQIKRTKSLY